MAAGYSRPGERRLVDQRSSEEGAGEKVGGVGWRSEGGQTEPRPSSPWSLLDLRPGGRERKRRDDAGGGWRLSAEGRAEGPLPC